MSTVQLYILWGILIAVGIALVVYGLKDADCHLDFFDEPKGTVLFILGLLLSVGSPFIILGMCAIFKW